jgi:hypothetical protein
MPAGRPTSYRPEYAAQAERLCRLGATDRELADFFEVSEQTINAWKEAHPEFLESLKRGKRESDANVADRLYQRAMGYSHEAVKIFMPSGADKPVYATYTEHYAPDTTACIFWLKNRRPDLWRDVQGREHTGRIETHEKTAEEKAEEARRLMDETFGEVMGRGADVGPRP